MAQATLNAPDIATLADLVRDLGDIPLDRIRLRPAPGTAVEQDLINLRDRDKRLLELVDGTLVEKAVGLKQSILAWFLGGIIKVYLDQNDLGFCAGADGTMRFAPGLVLIPDLSFFSWDRCPGRVIPEEPIPDLVPDLAVEVLSVSNTRAEMDRKVRAYFKAGARLVWLIDPQSRTVRVLTAVDQSATLNDGDVLDGGDVLPGFTVAVRELFESGEGPGRTSR